MGSRTYLPTLVGILQKLCVYMTRYDRQIRDNLDPDWIPAFNALQLACSAFMALVNLPEGE